MRGLICAFVALWALVGAASAENDKMRFTVYVQGAKTGELKAQGRERSESYSAQIALKMRGEMAALFEAKVAGLLADGVYAPESYKEKSQIAGRSSNLSLKYQDGAPALRTRAAQEHWLAPESEAAQNKPDPASVFWQLVKPKPAGAQCQLDLEFYDGARLFAVVTREPRQRGATLTCVGRVQRLEGFSEDELERGASFPFEIEYQLIQGGLYRAERITLPLAQGRVLLVRR